MVLTMAAVAASKGIEVTRLGATVQGLTEFVGLGANTRFVTNLDLGTGLSTRERAILYNSARHCEVHKMLRGQIEFQDNLAEAPGPTP
ncbi:MAG TPA: hypothetical protein VLC52_09060 [Anaerolineae bacterium]|nr:hypothetical protein [Anaerolineae bacterium]